MPRTKNPYTATRREQMVPLARAERTIESLDRKLVPCEAKIYSLIKQAEFHDGPG